MGSDRVVIGNVTFNKTEVLNSRKVDENTTCMNGQLWEVKTTSGIYRFRDGANQNNRNTLTDKHPTIFGGQIKNCNIESIYGTAKDSMRYSIYNSYVHDIDLSNGKSDSILVDSNSKVNELMKDKDDIVQISEDNPDGIKHIVNMYNSGL